MHHLAINLYATKAEHLCPCGLYRHVCQDELCSAIQSRGPWLSRALCCRTGSWLTMASSETLHSSAWLIFFVQLVLALRSRMDWNREVPQFAPRICHTVPSSVPRRSHQVQVVISSLTVIAFAISTLARQSQVHARRFTRGHVTRLQSSLNATARCFVSPHRQGRLLPSFRLMGHPCQTLDMTTQPNNQLSWPDFHRQDTRPYGLRMESMEFKSGETMPFSSLHGLHALHGEYS
jgi:hypothetical protein